MSQVNVGTTQLNTLTSGGSTISIPKNITVSGNINFTGDLLQNGVLFETLPSHNPKTAGAILMSDGKNAFWGTALATEGDVGGNNNFGFGYNDYRPNFDKETLEPKKTRTTSLFKTSKNNGAF